VLRYKSVSRFCVYTERDLDNIGAAFNECKLQLGPCFDARQMLDSGTDGKRLSKYIYVVTIKQTRSLDFTWQCLIILHETGCLMMTFNNL
jgi:hypothetical protein